MAEPNIFHFHSEKILCFINLALSLILLIVSGTMSFWNGEPMTGWLLYGCGIVLAAAYAAMGKLDAGTTPKALLSALCQPPLILYLLGKGELSGLSWLFLCAGLILTGAYFRVWVTLPQFLFSDLMLLLHVLWNAPESESPFSLPFAGFQLAGLLVLLFVWRGGFYRRDYHLLSEELDGTINLFGDVYNRLQQGFDRTLVRLGQMTEQQELLSECSTCLRGATEPVFSGVQKSVRLLEQLQGKIKDVQDSIQKTDKIINATDDAGRKTASNVSGKLCDLQITIGTEKRAAALLDTQLCKVFSDLQGVQEALEQNRQTVMQVLGVIRNYQGDIRAIQQDARDLENLTRQTYSVLRVQKDTIRPTNV